MITNLLERARRLRRFGIYHVHSSVSFDRCLSEIYLRHRSIIHSLLYRVWLCCRWLCLEISGRNRRLIGIINFKLLEGVIVMLWSGVVSVCTRSLKLSRLEYCFGFVERHSWWNNGMVFASRWEVLLCECVRFDWGWTSSDDFFIFTFFKVVWINQIAFIIIINLYSCCRWCQ